VSQHACPSCGYLHPSEGAEVPYIVVNEIVYTPPPPPEPVVQKFVSHCPVCSSQGGKFESESAEEFNKHMAAGMHGASKEE
jgi:hypothetical protein